MKLRSGNLLKPGQKPLTANNLKKFNKINCSTSSCCDVTLYKVQQHLFSLELYVKEAVDRIFQKQISSVRAYIGLLHHISVTNKEYRQMFDILSRLKVSAQNEEITNFVLDQQFCLSKVNTTFMTNIEQLAPKFDGVTDHCNSFIQEIDEFAKEIGKINTFISQKNNHHVAPPAGRR